MFSEKFWSDYKVPQIFLSLSDSLCPLLKLSMNNNNVRLFWFFKKTTNLLQIKRIGKGENLNLK